MSTQTTIKINEYIKNCQGLKVGRVFSADLQAFLINEL